MKTKLDISMGGPTVPYYPNLAIRFKDQKIALVLSFLMHLSETQADYDGWVHTTPDILWNDLGIRYQGQLATIAKLNALGIVEEDHEDFAWNLKFRINEERLVHFLEMKL